MLADKPYSSRAIRAEFRRRKITAVVPESREQQGHRGNRGGRPVTYDRAAYKGRKVVERSFSALKNWRELATRYDKVALVYRLFGIPVGVE